MSQRLVNVVCMIFTLAAAVYLYAFMQEYSISGLDGAKGAGWDEADSTSGRMGGSPGADARPPASLESWGHSNQAEPPSRTLDLD